MMAKKIGQLLYITLLFQIITGEVACGQETVIEKITEKYKKYTAANPWEEVYLHTDRSDYIAGEELWFAAYLISRQTGKPSEISSITYVEILNSSNVPLVQKRISTPAGFGQGEILIPDTTGTGKYILRAYTNWMKNFFPVNCYVKEINIYNPIKQGGQQAKTTISCGVSGDSSFLRNKGNIWGMDARIDEKNIIVSVSCRDVTPETTSENCIIFIHTHGIINYSGILSLNGGNGSLILGRDKLISGINRITLFTSSGVPVADRYVYTPRNISSPVEITAPERSGKRDRLTVEVDRLLPQGFPTDTAVLSISVVPATGSDTLSNISDYLVFGTEFGPGQHDDSGILKAGIPDSILNMINSHWINWDAILADSLTERNYPAEKEGHTITGRLLRRDTRTPVPEQVLFLSVPGKKAKFQYSRTGINGAFSFRIPLSMKVTDIIIQPESPASDISLDFESPFIRDYRTHSFETGDEKLNIPDYLLRWGANVQVGKIYTSRYSVISEKSQDDEPLTRRFYGKPDIELIMDDYIKLPVMQEVFFELIQGVSLRERKTGYELTILDPVESRPYIKPPMLLADGVIIHDPAIIAGTDPEIVEQIDVVKERYIVGDYIIYGLVNVITRTGDFSRFTLPDYAVRLRFRSLDPVNTFWSPEYSREEERSNRLPDFRNTMYWNGSFKSIGGVNNALEFWSSDFAGEYEIIIQGMTTAGIPITARKKIKIN